jgi:hypothetical protein
MLLALVQWRHHIQTGAGLLVLAFGAFRLLDPLHPRMLARIRPTQLALWPFVVAVALGAPLMLVPIYLGLCETGRLDQGHGAAATLAKAKLGVAGLVSVVHSVAMIWDEWHGSRLPRSRPAVRFTKLFQSG